MIPANLRKHSRLCEEHGHDSICPPTEQALVPFKPDGQWPKGLGGNVYGPRRLRAARALISEITDGGRTIVERLAIMGGLMPDPRSVNGDYVQYNGSIQIRALVKLADIYYGKQIKVSGSVKNAVEHSGVIQHQATLVAPEVAAKLARMTDDQLDKLEAAYEALQLSPPPDEKAEDAVFEAVESGEEPSDG